MQINWNTASTDQKLEMLREDIKRLFDIANATLSKADSIVGFAHRTDSMLKEVAAAVEKLESQNLESQGAKMK
jgi:hypothetical protein